LFTTQRAPCVVNKIFVLDKYHDLHAKYFIAFSILLDGLAHISAIFLLKMQKSRISAHPNIQCTGVVDFWIFWIFNCLQFAIDGKNNSKTQVEKMFFFIFMSSYEELSFLK
jgi:hypothetical protein